MDVVGAFGSKRRITFASASRCSAAFTLASTRRLVLVRADRKREEPRRVAAARAWLCGRHRRRPRKR
jgi:hypothetical protein